MVRLLKQNTLQASQLHFTTSGPTATRLLVMESSGDSMQRRNDDEVKNKKTKYYQQYP